MLSGKIVEEDDINTSWRPLHWWNIDEEKQSGLPLYVKVMHSFEYLLDNRL